MSVNTHTHDLSTISASSIPPTRRYVAPVLAFVKEDSYDLHWRQWYATYEHAQDVNDQWF